MPARIFTVHSVKSAFGVSEAWSRRQLKEAAARGMVAEKQNRYRTATQGKLPAFEDPH